MNAQTKKATKSKTPAKSLPTNNQDSEVKLKNTYRDFFLSTVARAGPNSNGTALPEARRDGIERSFACDCVARERQALKAESQRRCYLLLSIATLIAGILLSLHDPAFSIAGTVKRSPLIAFASLLFYQSIRADKKAQSLHDKAESASQTREEYLIYQEKKDDKSMLAFAKTLRYKKETLFPQRSRSLFGGAKKRTHDDRLIQ